MDALCAAIPVARALLRVADATTPSAVEVWTGSRRALLRVEDGCVWELSGVDSEPLGDTLLALGALDAGRHRVALASGFPAERVGAWLVSVGAASEASVRAALMLQLSERVEQVLRMRGAELFLCTRAEPARAGFQVSVALVPSVYAGLLKIARELPQQLLLARAGQGALRTTRLGHWLEPKLRAAAIDVSFASLSQRLEPGQLAERAALRAIGALVDQSSEPDGYSLLLRKRRELQSRSSARCLLDLPESARPELARPAFRKLAQKLHPDRFFASQPGLTALSNEVMRALASAEAELTAQAHGRSGALGL